MAKDLEFGNDIRTDMVGDTNDDNVGKDLNNDLANDKGVDLNKSTTLSKAFFYDFIPPPLPVDLNPVTEIVAEAPEPSQENQHINEALQQFEQSGEATINVPYDIRGQMIEEGMGPATDTRGIENQQPSEPEYGEHDD